MTRLGVGHQPVISLVLDHCSAAKMSLSPAKLPKDSSDKPKAENDREEAASEQKLLANALLSASRRRDVPGVRNLLKNGVSANVQDAATGYAPLHATILGPESGKSTNYPLSNGDGKAAEGEQAGGDEERVLEIVELLLENGAIWNDLDANDETPGCIAWRVGLKRVYDVIVQAGVRAELLLGKLEELEGRSEVEEEEEVLDLDAGDGNEVENGNETKADDNNEPRDDYIDHWDSNAAFLHSTLKYTNTQLLDSSSNAVMMDWEAEIMARHATTLLPAPGLRAMNIGHGMGIVDAAIQTHSPKEHHIVEAHPAVLKRMRETGWYDKPGVRVHEGRWQDVLPRLVREGYEIDAIYYDTFAEGYGDLKRLFQEEVIGLLAEGGRFGFYNGLGADRRVCYDVYTNVSLDFCLPLSLSVVRCFYHSLFVLRYEVDDANAAAGR